MQIQCFWLEYTDALAQYLRRYTSSGRTKCPKRNDWGHNASVRIENRPHKAREPIDLVRVDETLAADARWPKTCDCGYEFTPEDERQIFQDWLMRRIDTNELLPLRDAPIGAMWDAFWLASMKTTMSRPDDGITLMVMTPQGEFFCDGKASNGPGWTRTGDPRSNPPTVTANPSIGPRVGETYHAWLRNGVLVPA
jgi:hypothetical protein